MRAIIAATVLVVFATMAVSAQPVAADPATAQIHRGKTKMGIGVGLVGVGLVMIPLTVMPARPSETREGPAMWSGLGLTALGSGIIWWGAQERRQAVPKPQMTFGVAFGRNNGGQIRRTW